MRKKSTTYLLIITLITSLALNMAHPVTPVLIKSLNLPTFMFGVFFATMSIGNFLGSPIFGGLSDNNGRIKYMIIGLLGYGISQLGFGFSSNTVIIVIFRFLGGFFVTSYLTVVMAYLTDITNKNNRLKYISYFAAATTIGSALGSLTGGLIGNINYKNTFLVQFIFCVLISIIIWWLLLETVTEKSNDIRIKFNMIPIKNFSGGMSKNLNLVIFVVILFFFASTSYNSSINYYIESVLNLPPSFNGMFLSVAGIIGFLANLLVTPYLDKKFDDVKVFKFLTFLLGFILVLAVLSPSTLIFFAFIILFVAVCSIHVPLQQSLVTKISRENHGSNMGLLNSSKAIGMIFGSLFAGFIFDFGSKLPFLIAGIILIIGAIVIFKSDIEVSENIF